MKKFRFQFCIALLLSSALFSCAQDTENLLSATAFSQKLNAVPDKQVIDVRTPEEYKSGHLKEARNINIYDADFAEQINRLDKEKPVFVYCKAGSRSAKAADQMRKAGIKQVYDLQGGILAWTNNNLPWDAVSPAKTDTFTKNDFQKLISENKAVLIDFYSPWCLPCKKMEPSFEKLSKEFQTQVLIKRIDIDQAASLSKEMHVENIPVISIYKNGVEQQRVNGFKTEEELRALIKIIL